VRAKQERWDDALKLYDEALALKREAGDKREQGVTLHAMGNVRAKQERWDDALKLYDEALALAREANARDGIQVITASRARLQKERKPPSS
ncbi:MAG: hypothetical protein BWK77_01365, partial [Verrucomicrobia bacterium A1]